jgi:hypothetical protein
MPMIENIRLSGKTVQLQQIAVGEARSQYVRLDDYQTHEVNISVNEAVLRFEQLQEQRKKEKEQRIWNAVRNNLFLPDED